MSEQEMMALVNPMKAVGIVIWVIWLIINSIIASRSAITRNGDTDEGDYIAAIIWSTPVYLVITPLMLVVQLGIFFQGMNPSTTKHDISGGLMVLAVCNLGISLVLLRLAYEWATEVGKDFPLLYVGGSSVSMVFAAVGLLGLGVLIGFVDITTFYALRLYLIELLVNGIGLACFVCLVVIFIAWLAD